MKGCYSYMDKVAQRDERREMISLFWPVFIEQGLTIMIGMVSAMMVSNVGDFAVSGVNLVDTINFMVISVFNALAAGATVVVAQKIGARKADDAGETAGQAIAVCVLSASVLGLLAIFGGGALLRLLYGSAEENVLQAGSIYFMFSGFSYPLLGLFVACAGIMRASRNSRTPMIASVLSNIVNISLAYLFIRLGLGVVGVSIAMLCARATSGIFCYIMLLRDHSIFTLKPGLPRLKMSVLRPILNVGVPSGIDTFIFNGARVVMTVFMSGMGTAALHANAIANSLSSFMNLPGNAISIISVTLVGQAYGARLFKKVKQYMLKLCGYASLMQVIIFIPLYFLLDFFIGLYGASEETRGLVRRLVITLGVLSPFIWGFAFCLPQMLRACGDARATMAVSVSSLFALRVFGAWFFGIHLGWGVFGVWTGMFFDWFGRGIGFILRALSNKWNGGKKPVDEGII